MKRLKRLILGLSIALGVLFIFAIACGTSDAKRSTNELPIVKAELTFPPNVPAATSRNYSALVKAEIEIVEKVGQLADGVEFEYWTFGGTVPGPMIRVREGDIVEIHLKNPVGTYEHDGAHFPHSIDLHAVTGPGGGAKVTQIAPGEVATFRFKALNPGLYVYHCATPIIPMHVANGMYGLIVVEPKNGFPEVDREFYVMEGDFYTVGKLGEKGFQQFSVEKLMAETPEYVVFNGSTTSLAGEKALKANVGETVRIYFGVGGPNIISSFHVIGEIFDRVYAEGATYPVLRNVQTTLVPAGGATIVEFKLEVPGNYLLVDHSLSRIHKGAVGILAVEGEENLEVFEVIKMEETKNLGH